MIEQNEKLKSELKKEKSKIEVCNTIVTSIFMTYDKIICNRNEK